MAQPQIKAYALCVSERELIVCCPHCWDIHKYEVEKVPDAKIVPAVCDESKSYSISGPFQTRQLYSAMANYEYDLDRKKRHYAKKKAEKAEMEKKATT